MANLEIDGQELVVQLSIWERWGALRRSDIRVPLSSVASVTPVDMTRRQCRGLRAPGTGLPGKVALGTWRWRGVKDFVAAYNSDSGVVVDLIGQDFTRLVISGDIPEEVLALG